MECYVGLDISLNQTSICVVDETRRVIKEGETIYRSLAYAGVSVLTVFVAVWVMQATTRGAGLGSRRARLLLAQRVTIGSLAVALAFNAATPFVTPDPPWFSDVPS